jgi:hypothetical protein
MRSRSGKQGRFRNGWLAAGLSSAVPLIPLERISEPHSPKPRKILEDVAAESILRQDARG